MKKIYILPNLFTTANLFCGVLALSWVIQADQDKFIPAAFLIILAMVFDFVDGQVARLYHVTSRFGVEYDSMADFMTFGIATTFLVYRMFLVEMGRLGIGLAFLYAVFCALRLARFNTQVQKEEKTNFTGLPSPVSAGLLISFIIFMNKYHLEFLGKTLIPFLIPCLCYLMVSTHVYPALETLQIRRKKPFVYLVVLVLALAIIIFWAEVGLLFSFLSYTSIGLVQSLRLKLHAKKASESDKALLGKRRF